MGARAQLRFPADWERVLRKSRFQLRVGLVGRQNRSRVGFLELTRSPGGGGRGSCGSRTCAEPRPARPPSPAAPKVTASTTAPGHPADAVSAAIPRRTGAAARSPDSGGWVDLGEPREFGGLVIVGSPTIDPRSASACRRRQDVDRALPRRERQQPAVVRLPARRRAWCVHRSIKPSRAQDAVRDLHLEPPSFLDHAQRDSRRDRARGALQVLPEVLPRQTELLDGGRRRRRSGRGAAQRGALETGKGRVLDRAPSC